MTQAALDIALCEAEAAAERGEVPVGAALLAADGSLLARTGNRIRELADPTAHAEILAIRAAAQALGNERLVGTTLVVSLEPCAMCAGAIALARVGTLAFSAEDPKGGGVLHGAKVFDRPTCHHRPELIRLEDRGRSAELLRAFFRSRRQTRAV